MCSSDLGEAAEMMAATSRAVGEISKKLDRVDEDRHDMELSVGALSSSIGKVIEANEEILQKLSKIEGIQVGQGTAMTEVKGLVGVGKDDRARMQGEIGDNAWISSNNKSDVRTLKARVEMLEMRLGITQPPDPGGQE